MQLKSIARLTDKILPWNWIFSRPMNFVGRSKSNNQVAPRKFCWSWADEHRYVSEFLLVCSREKALYFFQRPWFLEVLIFWWLVDSYDLNEISKERNLSSIDQSLIIIRRLKIKYNFMWIGYNITLFSIKYIR